MHTPQFIPNPPPQHDFLSSAELAYMCPRLFQNHANANQKRTHLWRRTWHIGQQILGDKARRVGSTCFWPKINTTLIIVKTYISWYDTVDGRNPAPVDRQFIPLFTRVLYIPGGCLGSLPSTITLYIMHMFNKGIYPINTHYIIKVYMELYYQGAPIPRVFPAFSQGNLTC